MDNTLYTKGRWNQADGPQLQSINPATGEVVWEGATASVEQVAVAVEAAKASFEVWHQLDIHKRIGYLNAFAQKLMDEKDVLAKLISEEMGKPVWESQTEVGAMIKKIAISIEAFEDRCQEVIEPFGDAQSVRRYKPHGAIAVFGPFNLPGHLPNGHIIPALLAGNTIIYKPSELTPKVGIKIMDLWHDLDLPPGVINCVIGAKEVGEALSQHPDIDGLFFTGSSKTGRIIHQAFAGQPQKILALEMGGNNPLIVDEIDDIKAAAYLTILSAFITSGQRCVCARRLIVTQGPKEDEYIEHLLDLTKKLKIGACTKQPEPFMGPVIHEEAAKSILEWQEKFISQGAQALIKAQLQEGHKTMLSPGILDVTNVSDRPDEEIFGPLLQLIRVNDFDDAVKEANKTAYGLSAGLLSDNRKKYEDFLKLSKAGIINFNRQITGANSKAPFGGVGLSGNHNPSAYFAADYCSYPIASIEEENLTMPKDTLPGIELA